MAKKSTIMNTLRAYDGVLEIFSAVGLSSVLIILFVSQAWFSAGALVTTGVFEFLKSHFYTAGAFNLTNTMIFVSSLVLSYGDNVYQWFRK